jgi:hypothetical protein
METPTAIAGLLRQEQAFFSHTVPYLRTCNIGKCVCI